MYIMLKMDIYLLAEIVAESIIKYYFCALILSYIICYTSLLIAENTRYDKHHRIILRLSALGTYAGT